MYLESNVTYSVLFLFYLLPQYIQDKIRYISIDINHPTIQQDEQ